MKRGMLWFDDDARRTLREKIAIALRYFRRKYPADPNICFVNAAQLVETGREDGWQIGDVQVVAKPFVLKDHLQIGVENGGQIG